MENGGNGRTTIKVLYSVIEAYNRENNNAHEQIFKALSKIKESLADLKADIEVIKEQNATSKQRFEAGNIRFRAIDDDLSKLKSFRDKIEGGLLLLKILISLIGISNLFTLFFIFIKVIK